MGKRSNYERRPNDFYPTPVAAVVPLIPWLRGIRTFAEPCAGAGDLVRHLEGFGLRCVYSGDITTGQDALACAHYNDGEAIITNSPWTRRLLHLLIRHFEAIAPTWLLLDQDWACTQQAVPYLASCTDILSIGRVKWIPGTRSSGVDNAAWYRFTALHNSGPVFHPFRSAPSGISACQQCGKSHRPQRSDAAFCSARCRQRAYRGRISRNASVTEMLGG